MCFAAQLFLAFQCESFAYDDFAVPPKSKAYLQASLDVECFPRDESDRRHAAIMAWTYPFIVLWPVAMPLLYVLLLLWNGYEDAYYWYEIFELYKKLTLTSFLLFINSRSGGNLKLLRLAIGLMVSLGGLMLQFTFKPFRKDSDDALNCVAQLLLVVFFLFGILLKLCNSAMTPALAAVDNSCSSLVGLDSTDTLSVLMLCVGFVLIVVLLGMPVYQLVFVQAVPILRDASTMEPVLLLFGEGERYHLFLCVASETRVHPIPFAFTTLPTFSHAQEPHLDHWARPVRAHKASAPNAIAWHSRLPRRRRPR